MEQKDLFYDWVPLYVRLPVLFLIFFTILTANGVFAGNSIDMYSSLAVLPEPYTMALNAMYIGMGLGIIFHIRLKLRFANKTLMLWGMSLVLLMNIICTTTNNPMVAPFACLILGFAKVSSLLEVFSIWMFIWSKKMDTSRMYPFLYFTALAGASFVTWLTTILAYDYNWRYANLVIITLLLFCILFVLFLVEKHPLRRKYPLYQVDYFGLALLATSMMLLNYAVVFGTVEDWFESWKITAAFFGSGITLLLFIKWELSLKRPMFDFTLFQRSNFRLGLIYFLLIGLFVPTTFQTAFSGGVLHYETYRNIELNLYMIPGILVACIFCYFWFYLAFDPDILIIGGFAGFVIYYILMYNNFGTAFAIRDFWLPGLIKGFATATLYITVGLRTTRNSGNQASSAVGVMILVRSFLASGVFTSLYGYFLYTQRVRSFDHLVGLSATTNSVINDQSSLTNVYRTLQEQATLAACKQISGYIITVGVILLIVLLTRFGYKRLIDVTDPR